MYEVGNLDRQTSSVGQGATRFPTQRPVGALSNMLLRQPLPQQADKCRQHPGRNLAVDDFIAARLTRDEMTQLAALLRKLLRETRGAQAIQSRYEAARTRKCVGGVRLDIAAHS
jgi:hypothetical protein